MLSFPPSGAWANLIKSYDLFMHNCNNFSNDFAMFLVGKGIPEHITSLPKTVLDTPFGQMLKPQLDRSMREVTQAPIPSSSVPTPSRATTNGYAASSAMSINGNGVKPNASSTGVVHNVTRLTELHSLLQSAKTSCAVIFFTSATCPPCKLCYPAYEELAAEAGNKAVLIKVDLSKSYDIGPKYHVRATPTFMTFLKGEKLDEWSGANPGRLMGNVRMLVQMAHPPHPHSNLRLPNLQRPHQKPVTYSKVPPLDKLMAKLGPANDGHYIDMLKDFIAKRASSDPASVPLPPLQNISATISVTLDKFPIASLFPLIDLLRVVLVDPRVSGFFAEDDSTLINKIFASVNAMGDDCPYTLRITTIQLACNLFTSALFPPQLLGHCSFSTPLIQLVSLSLLDEKHSAVRVSAASLAFNIAAFNHMRRLEQKEQDLLPESAQVELVASILEAVGKENDSKETVKGLIFAVGLIAYCCDMKGEVKDVLEALDAKAVIKGKEKMMIDDKGLTKEVIEILG